jgi:hypothetical protein
MSKQLNELPHSLRSGLMPKKSILTYEGLTTKLDVSRIKNSDLSKGLPIYRPLEDSGLEFGVMFFEHDNFRDTYEVNPHKINFDKDREALCIGSTLYTTNIRRYVKGTVTNTYTLKLNKNVRSPLFVPYQPNNFLVLEPLNNQSDDPPLILDNDVDPPDDMLIINGRKPDEDLPGRLFEDDDLDIRCTECGLGKGLCVCDAIDDGDESESLMDSFPEHEEAEVIETELFS